MGETVKNMEAERYIENPELLSCLAEKLPPTTKNQWFRYKADLFRKGNNVDLRSLGEWFKYELDAQFAGSSVKDINRFRTLERTDDEKYIPDGKELP